jgi:hypothetical protein
VILILKPKMVISAAATGILVSVSAMPEPKPKLPAAVRPN